MSWRLFRWTWRLEGPLFVGTSPAGTLNRCRPYISARAIWGAVTAEVARLRVDDHQQYLQVGNELRSNVRFSYLYPAELVGKDWLAWLPEYREGDGLAWVREGDNLVLADRRFRRRLLWTRPATAIDPDNDAALDGSLRETECVQPHWRREDDSPGSPVGMVGYVLLQNNAALDRVLRELKTLFVGGDTRYGLGRMQSVEFEEVQQLFGATVELDQPRVFMRRVLAHAITNDSVRMCGELEALGGWDRTGQLQGFRISGPVWTPGSRIHEGDRTLHFRIDEHGLWHLKEQDASKPPSNGAPPL